MVNRPLRTNAFEFVVVSALRAHQLLAGSVPRLGGDHSPSTMAQMEVAGGFVSGTYRSASSGDGAVGGPKPAV